MTNKERFIEYARKHNIAQSEEILDRRLAIIPKMSRKVVETRWGLNGGAYCNQFDALGKKLGIHNPKEVYAQAMYDLECAAFAEVVADCEEIGDWNVVVGLGRLATCILGDVDVDMVAGKNLMEALSNRLPQREKDVIFLRFGLDGSGTKTLQVVADTLGLTKERVRQIENKTIRKMKHPRFVKSLYIPEKTQQKSEIKTEATPIEELDFTVRTYNILKRAYLNTIGDILNNPQKLSSVRNFGEKSAMEIIQILDSTGVVSSEGKTAKDVLEEVFNV